MSNKPLQKLDLTDIALRISTPVGMEDGIKQIILRRCGFELHNTRPYHNYETWSDGYVVIGRKDGKADTLDNLIEGYNTRDNDYIITASEDLDDAVIDFLSKVEATGFGTGFDRFKKWLENSTYSFKKGKPVWIKRFM